MSDPLYVSLAQLEQWVDSGGILFDNNILTLKAEGIVFDGAGSTN
ncbi:MAG: hypothetical protein R3C68_01455 [Myxococcota bacterium]